MHGCGATRYWSCLMHGCGAFGIGVSGLMHGCAVLHLG